MASIQNVKLKLPSSVFESEYKEEIGLLNKAAVSKGEIFERHYCSIVQAQDR